MITTLCASTEDFLDDITDAYLVDKIFFSSRLDTLRCGNDDSVITGASNQI